MTGLKIFNKASRPALFENLSKAQFDLLIIGGGITGASIFRDAALRGMRVALFEANDFASGTSGRSSKLIHGGLRYLKNMGLGLARESCQERNLHIRLNKRLVRPIPFLIPLYRGLGESSAALRFGMLVYEVLSGLSNHRFHRFLDREETLLLAPGLPVDRLTGGCLYYDAVVSDTRWTMEIIKDGVRQGGVALNYAPVVGLHKQNNNVVGAQVEDRIGHGSHEVYARSVVNATGVFADKIRQMDRPEAARLIHLSKGTHLVFTEQDVPLAVTTVFSSPIDGRLLFLIKRDGCYLYGTTDDWEEADPSEPMPAVRDVEYLLESIRRFMPEAVLDRTKVQFVYSGFRPLFSRPNNERDPSRASREDYLEVSPSGMISVVGGKLTTARLTAIRVLERVREKTRTAPAWSRCRTHELSIGGTNEAVAEGLSFWVRQCPRLIDYFRILFERYGLDAHEICPEAMRISLGRHPDPRAEPIRAEVQYVCRHEMVCTLEDIMDRRAGFLYWNAEKRLERLRHGENVIREELNLTQSEFEEQFSVYKEHLERRHSLPQLSSV